MKVSTNAIRSINKHFGSAGEPAPNGIEDLLRKIGAQLGAVEETIEFGKRFDGVITARVVSCEDHPDADRLHVCKIDDGGQVKDIERDKNGHVQVVCGAPNVRAGLLVAWLPPGATVPETSDKSPFVLDARNIRGQKSNGMLASSKELGLSDNHDGILEIDKDVQPGISFAEAYDLKDDIIINIENKMFTHRPDCFGWLGVAREIAGIYNRPYKSPDWYHPNPVFPAVETQELKLEVHNKLPKLVPRFTAVTMSNVKVGPSPIWLQIQLARAGLRPINNIVDYTNFFMIETGQPIHAYDYDKITALTGSDHAILAIRHPEPGEKIKLLNGKEIEPWAESIMIAAGHKLIGVGGVMGGADTEVDENTKNIIIECANFDMYSIRRSSMANGLFTDAVTRFNKGQSPLQNLAVLAKIIEEVRENAGGKIASQLIDDNHLPQEVMDRGSLHPNIKVSARFINNRLGLKLAPQEIRGLLSNVEFGFVETIHSEELDDPMEISAPFWRTDIEIPEDIVEEVGRLKGYEQLPHELPSRPVTAASLPALELLKSQIRDILVAAGNNELQTYSFISSKLLAKTSQEAKPAFKLRNALSPELELIRTSLLPTLIEKIHPNHKSGHDLFGLFEIGKTHNRHEIGDDDLPAERVGLSYVFSAETKAYRAFAGSPFYQAKYNLSHLLDRLGIEFKLQPLSESTHLRHSQLDWESSKKEPAIAGSPVVAGDDDTKAWWQQNLARLFEPKRSAMVIVSDKMVGIVGEFKSDIAHNFKLPDFAAGFELDLSQLVGFYSTGSDYQPLLRFPATDQDVCLKVELDVNYAKLENLIRQALGEDKKLRLKIMPLSIYQREDDTKHKQITYRLTLQHRDRTLKTEEVNKLLDNAVRLAADQTGAIRV